MSSSLTRRTFLKQAAGAAAATALGGLTAGCQADIQSTTERHRAVVIGSGFGGAIAAYHLAQAGVETIVIERGRRWPITPKGDTFPTFFHPDRRSAWLSSTPTFPNSPPALFKHYVGLIERVKGKGMDALCGAAVGGGSVVYGGMMLKPRKDIFYKVFPKEIDYDELDREYYPRVKEMIGLAPVPDDVLAHERYKSTRLFLEHAARAGYSGVRINDAVNWDVVRDELAGRVVASASVGESIFGMNSGAKNSVDRNYLKLAEDSGAVVVYPQHVVQSVSQNTDETYLIEAIEIDESGTPLLRKLITADYLFLGAGSIGTTRLLLRAKAQQTLSRLSDEVGGYWGNNGDRLYVRYAISETTLPRQGSPACSAIFDHDNPEGPATILHGPGPFEIETHSMPILGMGIPDELGHLAYDAGNDEVVPHWPRGADANSVRNIERVLNRLDNAAGGAIFDLNWVSGASTYHPLGGAVLGKVTDWYGRVNNYRRLYVVDSSLIPGSTGCCNPAWTVAALAERCLDRIIEEDVLS